MDKVEAVGALERFREALERLGVRVDRLVLFGSYAQGTQREGSDIDVVVVSEDFEDRSYWQRIQVLAEAIAEVFEPIEAVAMTPGEWEEGTSTIAQFARQGEVL
ncbi:MAG: nucleotidyltransferase domain-containing protein [Candidatus Brocadiia bacterium]